LYFAIAEGKNKLKEDYTGKHKAHVIKTMFNLHRKNGTSRCFKIMMLQAVAQSQLLRP
jgi:hypothetical protein